MKKLCCLLITIFTINCYSQINFEKGYYVNNTDQKIECLIKNVDWRNNPTNFDYKTSENSEVKNANITDVKEFGIYNISKFIRTTVKIDRSSESVNALSKERGPIFMEEQLFLKLLNEGKANLYLYKDVGLSRYFYNQENSNIEQLVYKKYETTEGKLGINNYYKQQLLKELKCSSITLKKIENLLYKRNNLTKLFKDYNICNGSDTKNYSEIEKKDLFNLTIRPRLTHNSSVSIFNSLFSSRDIDLGKKTQFGFGIEVEFILPFNKNKWAVIIEPTYQGYKSSRTIDAINISGGKLITDVTYSSVEVPVGLRHYFFINNDSKIFMNVSYTLDLVLNSSIEFKRIDDSIFNSYEAKPKNFLTFGVGFKYNDRYSLELRYQTNRDILSSNDLDSSYKTLSFIIGYSIF